MAPFSLKLGLGLHARIQTILSEGSNFDNVFFFYFFFLVDEGAWEDPNTTISGSSPAHQRTDFFLVDEEWEDPNTTISGSSSARQRNAM